MVSTELVGMGVQTISDPCRPLRTQGLVMELDQSEEGPDIQDIMLGMPHVD